jgi:hypothetical protein
MCSANRRAEHSPLHAANSGAPIGTLAAYEVPIALTANARFEPGGYHAGLAKALAETDAATP